MTGAAVIGTAGDTWNGLTGIGTAAYTSPYLIYANNTNSTIKLNVLAGGGSFDNNCSSWGSFSLFLGLISRTKAAVLATPIPRMRS